MSRFFIAGALGLLVGCSAGNSSLGSSGAGSGSGAQGNGTGGGSGLPGDLGGGQDLSSGRDECGGDIYRGEGSILDMYILMDRSGSMAGIDILGFVTLGNNVWQPVGTAIGEFVVDPQSEGISAGIGFFPLDNGDACDPGIYQPAAEIGPLTANGGAIQAAIVGNGPTGGQTPTVPAFQGAMDHAKQWAAQNPGHKVVIVLATDGEPNQCDSTVDGVAQIAANGVSGSPRVETYVIGIGNVAGLDQIAQAGGSGKAIVVPNDPAVASQEFLDAMNDIRGQAIPCDYGIPPEGQGTPELVNLKFSSSADAERIVPYVPGGGDACGDTEGWYYDNPTAPTRLVACPATCSLVGTAAQAQVSVVVGCAQVLR